MMGFASTTADQVCAKPRKYATCRPRQYVAAPASKVLERYRKSVTKNERINHFYMVRQHGYTSLKMSVSWS